MLWYMNGWRVPPIHATAKRSLSLKSFRQETEAKGDKKRRAPLHEDATRRLLQRQAVTLPRHLNRRVPAMEANQYHAFEYKRQLTSGKSWDILTSQTPDAVAVGRP